MSNESSSSGKKKKTKKRFSVYKFLLSTVLILLCIVVIGGGLTLGMVYAWIKDAKPLNVEELFNLNQTTYIVDENDKLIDKLNANENRSMVTLDKIPKDLQNAFIAIEDKRFYSHNGIDPYRILGALKEDIRTGTTAQGGSTITQQLIKNIYLTPDKLLKRKVIEAYYAMQLERQFMKDKILEAYLNTIGLGHNVAGVQAASLYYFGKNVGDLTLAESAMIAGITRNPSANSPYLHYDNAVKRQKIILNEMLKQGMIDQSQYDTALNQEIKLTKIQSEVDNTYFSDIVIKDVLKALVDKLGYTQEEAERKLNNGGLKIIATIDTDMQNIVEEAFSNTKLFPPSKEDSEGIIQPEAAAVIIDNATGELKAVMGGRSDKVRRGLNRATQSLRQPGSAIKPLAVYSPALDNGYTVGTVVDDKPIQYGTYSPNNYDRTFKGLTTIRDAIKSSINTIAVQIVQDIGPSRSVEYLQKFGLTTIVTAKDNRKMNDENLASMALGGLTKGVKPIELAAAYSVFPNNGVLTKPISFTKIMDKDGNVIYENKPEKSQVFSAQVAYLMVDIMRGVVSGGTGGNAALGSMPVAGKTGTTTESKDAWFVGYTPYYTAAVWMGHDDPTKMSFTGGKYPAMVWKAMMAPIHKDLKVKSFEMPSGLVSVDICTKSGKRPSDLCSQDPRGSTVKSELFIKGTEPALDSVCDVHVTRDIDVETGQLASPYCPASLVQSKVFIQRPVPFAPVEGKPAPADIIYDAPTEVCTKHTAGTETPTPTDGVIPTETPTGTPIETPTPGQ